MWKHIAYDVEANLHPSLLNKRHGTNTLGFLFYRKMAVPNIWRWLETTRGVRKCEEKEGLLELRLENGEYLRGTIVSKGVRKFRGILKKRVPGQWRGVQVA